MIPRNTIAMRWVVLLNLGTAAMLTYLLAPMFGAKPQLVSLYMATFAGVYLLLWLLSYFYHRKHFYKLPYIYSLGLFFLSELLKANIRLAYVVIAVHDHLSPAVVAVPLDVTTDFEIMVFANLITLTPGTLALDVSEDRKWLYVHTLFLDEGSREEFCRHLKENFEKKILAISR